MKQTENTHHELHDCGSLTTSLDERIFIPGDAPPCETIENQIQVKRLCK